VTELITTTVLLCMLHPSCGGSHLTSDITVLFLPATVTLPMTIFAEIFSCLFTRYS